MRRRSLHLSSHEIHKAIQEHQEVLPDSADMAEMRCRQLMNKQRQICHEAGVNYVPSLFMYEDVPTFLQDNDFIRGGYRAYYTY